jgi:hypothetical protein
MTSLMINLLTKQYPLTKHLSAALVLTCFDLGVYFFRDTLCQLSEKMDVECFTYLLVV